MFASDEEERSTKEGNTRGSCSLLTRRRSRPRRGTREGRVRFGRGEEVDRGGEHDSFFGERGPCSLRTRRRIFLNESLQGREVAASRPPAWALLGVEPAVLIPFEAKSSHGQRKRQWIKGCRVQGAHLRGVEPQHAEESRSMRPWVMSIRLKTRLHELQRLELSNGSLNR